MPANGRKAPGSTNTQSSVIQGEIRMPAIQLRMGAFSAALALLAATSSPSFAQKKYDTGASDTEIKIGNIMPYSGPASSYGLIGKTEAAYFKMINDLSLIHI